MIKNVAGHIARGALLVAANRAYQGRWDNASPRSPLMGQHLAKVPSLVAPPEADFASKSGNLSSFSFMTDKGPKLLNGIVPSEDEKKQLKIDLVEADKDKQTYVNRTQDSKVALDKLRGEYNNLVEFNSNLYDTIMSKYELLKAFETDSNSSTLSEDEYEKMNEEYEGLLEQQTKVEEEIDDLHEKYEIAKSRWGNDWHAANRMKEASEELKLAYKGANSGFISSIPNELKWNFSNSSKYGKMDIIHLQPDDKFDSTIWYEPEKLQTKAERKNINTVVHELNIKESDSENINSSLQESLSSIPRDKDAEAKCVKHSKVSLYTHGLPGLMEEGEDTVVPGDKAANFIARHLPPGDYKDKLTIASYNCYGGIGIDKVDLSQFNDRQIEKIDEYSSGKSLAQSIADRLKELGYSGIRITGSPFTMSASQGTLGTGGKMVDGDNTPIGTMLTSKYQADEENPSDDEISNKETIYTKHNRRGKVNITI